MSDLVKTLVEEGSVASEPERTHPKNCHACASSYMEPSGPADLICGHPDAGIVGIYLKWGRKPDGKPGFVVVPAPHCGDYTKFEQHPLRMQNGELKR